MTLHSKRANRVRGEANGIKTWGQRIRLNFSHASKERYSSNAPAAGCSGVSDEPPNKLAQSSQPNIPARPCELPISDAEYDLMRQALVRQHAAALVEQCYEHSLNVARWCVRVAKKRGLDAHTACLAGFFHDVYFYATGLRPLHAQNSAEQLKLLLQTHSDLSQDERETVCHMIFCHHDADKTQDSLSELLRDAHILSDFTDRHIVRRRELKRLTQLVPEWKLLDPQRSQVVETPDPVCQGNRSALAEVAQTLAAQRIGWYPDEPEALNIARYWPEADAFEKLSESWCAAFVYHCCYEAGFILPIHAPRVEQRFDSIKGWLDFASLLNNGFYHPGSESGFVPERGDIVIFNHITDDRLQDDHMGVVVLTSPERITVAEGNSRRSNVSDVVDYSVAHNVRGYIRLPNDYRASRPFN